MISICDLCTGPHDTSQHYEAALRESLKPVSDPPNPLRQAVLLILSAVRESRRPGA